MTLRGIKPGPCRMAGTVWRRPSGPTKSRGQAADFSRGLREFPRGQADCTLTLLPARRSASVRTDESSSQRISIIPGEKHDQ